MIGRSGERGSGISVLAVRHDDDDDDVYIYVCARAELLFKSIETGFVILTFIFQIGINSSL